MKNLIKTYKSTFLVRFDKDPGIPYFSVEDFPNLHLEHSNFSNHLNVTINYFIYYYDNPRTDKVILLCPGIGPGHTAYLTEIELLCKKGYKVITLDYMGCGSSEGDRMPSINEPTRDVVELINHLNLEQEIVIFGHSLGAYTALNVINTMPSINKAVIISGFIDVVHEMLMFTNNYAEALRVKNYEKKLDPVCGKINNWKYLKTTRDNLLFIHSQDDQIVSYKLNFEKVAKITNPSVKTYSLNHKGHNPTYSDSAIKFMTESIGGYERLLRENRNISDQERKDYFKDKPIGRMTEQDPVVWEVIMNFIER